MRNEDLKEMLKRFRKYLSKKKRLILNVEKSKIIYTIMFLRMEEEGRKRENGDGERKL